MGKIYIIMGKSASGKDTIYQKMVEDLKAYLKEIVLYTTRPIRDREQNGREYFFVTEQEYLKLKGEDKIIEERAYDTIHGIWRYFTVNDEQFDIHNDNCIMIGTLEAYLQIRRYFGEKQVIPMYVDLDPGVRLERALAREKKQKEPKYTEMCRRFVADESDFSEENLKNANITKRYWNYDLDRCIQEMEQDILKSLSS